MARRWRNHTDIDDATCRAIYNAVVPSGLPAHDVDIKNYSGKGGRGVAYAAGSSFHANARPFITIYIPKDDAHARYRWPMHGGYLDVVTGSRIEALVHLLAHELRHLWQGKAKGKPRGMVYGAKGRFSERDADAYALQMLRRYRRGELFSQEPKS